MSASEFDAVLSVEPEEQIVRAELDEARKKRRSGRARVINGGPFGGSGGGAAVGMATSFAMLRAWGFAGRRAGLAVAVQSVWNQFVILGFPVLAIAGLAAQGASNRTLELVAIIGLVAFAAMVVGFAVGLSSARLAGPFRRSWRRARESG